MATVVNGWTLLYHPVFGERYTALRDEARRLKGRLPPEDYRAHQTVRIFVSVRRLITEVAPTGPNTPEYRLRADLAKYLRAKGKGLPPRYRLFWIFSTTAKAIIYLYLNDVATLRTEGARTDPYVRFRRLIDRGSIGPDFESNLRAWQQPLTE